MDDKAVSISLLYPEDEPIQVILEGAEDEISFEEWLNQMSQEGWDLTHITHPGYTTLCIFTRIVVYAYDPNSTPPQ
jgi:hypothetical protein